MIEKLKKFVVNFVIVMKSALMDKTVVTYRGSTYAVYKAHNVRRIA